MIISSIDRCFVSVPDIDALTLYRDTIGLDIVAQGKLESSIVHGLWGLPEDVTAHSVCLKNKKQSTAIELVQLDPVPTKAVRDYAETYDNAYFHILFLVPDSEKIKTIFKNQDREWLTEPYHFPPLWSGSEVIEGWAYGPAREIVATLEYRHPPVLEERKLDGDFWTIHAMGQCVDDLEKAVAFYRDALGFEIVFEGRPEPGFYDEQLHLPKNTGLYLALVRTPNTNAAAIELFQTSVIGKILGSSPLELGIFMYAFESNDLDADMAKVQEQGFEVLTGPMEVETNLHGKAWAVNVEGPGKLRLELFQKTGR